MEWARISLDSCTCPFEFRFWLQEDQSVERALKMKKELFKHEILILNDASTDGTQEWIDNLGDDD